MKMYMQRAKPIRLGPFTTSKVEINNIIKAWGAISIAFGIVLSGGIFSAGFITMLLISALTVGLGFLLHELAHKLFAQHYGCFAEFRSFDSMLMLAIVMSFFGFVFVAPGAVMIAGPVGRRRNGIISAAGPAMNLILAVLFLLGLVFISDSDVFKYGYLINTWLGLFNMLPFWNFDGKKILNWNKPVYAIMVILGLGLMFVR